MWYKKSDHKEQPDEFNMIHNFVDRNHANAQMRVLRHLIGMLDEAIAIVTQTQQGAMNLAQAVMNHKKLTSFPTCVSALRVAIHVAKDSPEKFARYCMVAKDVLDKKLIKLVAMRENFAHKSDKIKMPYGGKKGLF